MDGLLHNGHAVPLDFLTDIPYSKKPPSTPQMDVSSGGWKRTHENMVYLR